MNSSQSLQDLTSGLNDGIIVKALLLTLVLNTVSGVALFLYDWLILLPEEIQFVWTKEHGLRPFNILYIAQRYMPFIDTVAITSIGMDLTGIALTEIVLTIRTWVLWKKNIKLSFGLPLFYICCWIPILYALNRYLQSQTCCVYSGGQSILYLCWAFLTVYEIGIVYYIFLFAWSAINLGTSISLSCFLIYDITTGHLT
ncbi:hypothetical protein EV361DRAFT_872094 [Lentinula raphanica]|nr:hypothetical protein FB446DRAFT_701102 [Lentinula raphanica]KAJ3966829.1 hypothetical protein EV361DRAFT_872094 [Lentinula raphanica]